MSLHYVLFQDEFDSRKGDFNLQKIELCLTKWCKIRVTDSKFSTLLKKLPWIWCTAWNQNYLERNRVNFSFNCFIKRRLSKRPIFLIPLFPLERVERSMAAEFPRINTSSPRQRVSSDSENFPAAEAGTSVAPVAVRKLARIHPIELDNG